MRECPQNIEKRGVQDLIFSICKKSNARNMFSLIGSTGRVEQKLADLGVFILSAEDNKEEFELQKKNFSEVSNFSLNYGSALSILNKVNFFKFDAIWLDFSGSLLTLPNLETFGKAFELLNTNGHLFVTSSAHSRGSYTEENLFEIVDILSKKFRKTIKTEYYNGHSGNYKYYLLTFVK